MAYLEYRSPQGKKRLKLMESPITIGRHPNNQIVLDDDLASRRHCIIEPMNGAFRVRDLGSRNGTKLNEKRISQDWLDNGDIVRIGQTEIHFIHPEQVDEQKKNKTPDFAAALAEDMRKRYDEATLDLDLNDIAKSDEPDYRQKLREVIDSALEKPFDENEITLIDNRGQVVHEAGSSFKNKDESHEGVRTFVLLLLACFRARATDLHLEPRVENAAIRLRVDGYMISAVEIPRALYKRLLGVVKILCEIDITQKNQVQDGHFACRTPDRRVDYRVSLTPSMHGQKLVLRVLDSSNAPSRLHELGLVPWMYEKVRAHATRDAGLLLACGPTGSGKTTTLYSCLREIDVEQRNAITIEDPVEYYIEGCTQIPIDHKQGNTFASILRSVLRQDPDVIFVGEIRDRETADVAMQASMTGHLVYTTVHAKDSISAIFRLLDLGVESYLVANAVNLIIAQRLVRLLCDHCKRPVKPTPTQNMKMGKMLEGVPVIHAPVGCRRCLRTGFVGRHALFELLEFTDQLRDVVLQNPSIQAIREVLSQGLFMTLQQFGYQLVAQGRTSIEEIDRVATSE